MSVLLSFIHAHIHMRIILHLPRSVEIWQKPWTSLHSNQVPCHLSRCVWIFSICETLFNTWFSLKCRLNTEIKVVHLCGDKQLIESEIINCTCSFLSQLRTVLVWFMHSYSSTLSPSQKKIVYFPHPLVSHNLLVDAVHSKLWQDICSERWYQHFSLLWPTYLDHAPTGQILE